MRNGQWYWGRVHRDFEKAVEVCRAMQRMVPKPQYRKFGRKKVVKESVPSWALHKALAGEDQHMEWPKGQKPR